MLHVIYYESLVHFTFLRNKVSTFDGNENMVKIVLMCYPKTLRGMLSSFSSSTVAEDLQLVRKSRQTRARKLPTSLSERKVFLHSVEHVVYHRNKSAHLQMCSPLSWKRTNSTKSSSNCSYQTAKAYAWLPSAVQKPTESFWIWSRHVGWYYNQIR